MKAAAHFTPWRVVAFTLAAVLAYLLWRGPERFYYESFGTWILSPLIYVRILPAPLNQWLLHGMRSSPLIDYFLYAAPVMLLVGSVAAGVVSIRRHSVGLAFLCLFLMGTVFSVYHCLQPLGITLVRY